MRKRSVVILSVGMFLLSGMKLVADCTSQPWTFASGAVTTNCGNVGIGLSGSPGVVLDVAGNANNAQRIRITNPNAGNGAFASLNLVNDSGNTGAFFMNSSTNTSYGGATNTLVLDNASNNAVAIATNDTVRLWVDRTGNVGVGTTSPGINSMPNTLTVLSSSNRGMLELATGQGDGEVGVGQIGFFANNNTSGKQIALIYSSTSGATAANRGGILQFWTKPDNGAIQERMILDRDGNLGIGVSNPTYKLHVNGDAKFTGTVYGGNIQATYQDVAEWVPAAEAMQAGTVVVVDRRSTNTVRPSSQPYDTRVAGVVSEQPGLLLGIEAPSKEMIATTGRVKVRVDATRGPIEAGDLLVTSDKPGVAMRSEEIDFGGVKIHRPGTLIGKALEPLKSGEGEILVLLSLQ